MRGGGVAGLAGIETERGAEDSTVLSIWVGEAWSKRRGPGEQLRETHRQFKLN